VLVSYRKALNSHVMRINMLALQGAVIKTWHLQYDVQN